RDYFYAGFNDYCLRTYEHIEGEEKQEADEYIYQIFMINNIKNELIMSLKNTKNEKLYLLYLYYKYYYLNEKENILNELKNINVLSSNGTILKSRILFDNNLLDECLDILENGSIEISAAQILFLLSIDREDLVKDKINIFLKMNDETPIVKIILAIFYLYTDNYKESFLLFEDLESLYTSVVNDVSTIIINGKGVSNMLSYEFNDAKDLLKNGLNDCKTKNGDIIYNLITTSLYLYELDDANDYLNKLYKTYPRHDSLDVLEMIDYEVENFVPDF
ncbi:coatomer subunit epsilon, putative, partial [Hepatocystis sp. ex Piliocolobus tephrosceles]